MGLITYKRQNYVLSKHPFLDYIIVERFYGLLGDESRYGCRRKLTLQKRGGELLG